MSDNPTILVILGATGDLTRRKIAPALYHLFSNGQLGDQFEIVGFSRRQLTDADFRERITAAVGKSPGAKEISPDFRRLFSYHQGLFDNLSDYQALDGKLKAIDKSWHTCANKLFYLAVPPKLYETIFRKLAESGLSKPCGEDGGWSRVLVEKPFGKNLKEAENLEALLCELFKEEQIYRIDHYLGKELMQNIMTFRFANNLLEDIWNNSFIEKIEIKLLEQIGIGNRGAYYDGNGALLDVGQNHMLQMLALATMEDPVEVTASAIRRSRAEAVKNLKPWDLESIKKNTVRGQYEGYPDEPKVAPDSNTETYFRIKTQLNLPRWEGVPIILESGKKMESTQKEIAVTFRHPVPCFCPLGAREHYKNRIFFRLQPDPGIAIQFWSKKPGPTNELESRRLDFHYEDIKDQGRLSEYAKLLLDCIAGDQTLFVSNVEAPVGWRFIDPIVNAWRKDAVPLHRYGQDDRILALAKKAEESIGPSIADRREMGVVGLGKMGAGIAGQLLSKNWRVVGFNRTPSVTQKLEDDGLTGAYSLPDLVKKLKAPRTVWLMLPAGKIVDEMIFGADGLVNHLSPGDIVVDAGNSFNEDSVRRGAALKEYGLKFADVGVSGGPKGARYGASLMVGGDRLNYEYLLPVLIDLSVNRGVHFFDGTGAGHFVKMVHNGIEYGMMQAIAEGFNLLKSSDYSLDLTGVASVYNHGSVIESSLVGWLEEAFKSYGEDLEGISGTVDYTGEGEWTIRTAAALGQPAPNIDQAFNFRVRSLHNPSYIGQILSALRHQFGGHAAKEEKDMAKPEDEQQRKIS